MLEGAQAGLSWSTILRKREGYRPAFAGFDAERVARFGDATSSGCSATGNRPQPAEDRVAIETRATLAVREECGSLAYYLWEFIGGGPLVGRCKRLAEIPAETDESRAMSKDLKRRGFRFVGPTSATPSCRPSAWSTTM